MPVEVHSSASVSPLADIEDSIHNTRIVIGAGSRVDSFVKVKPAGGRGDVIIGDHVTINSGCVIYTGNGVTIGNDVAIAANCTFAPVNHEFRDRNKTIREQRFQASRGGIIVEDDVWIGAGCVLLDGARVRKGAVVGSMTIVRGEVESYSIVAGNPMQVIGRRT